MRPLIQIVWLKRDLRIHDHAALCEAAKKGPVLPIFTWDPSVWSGSDYSTQHVMFIRECLDELKKQLQSIHLDLLESSLGIIDLLDALLESHDIEGIYSHEETGNLSTYNLDKQVAKWCLLHQIPWLQFHQNGVVRKLKNRDHWNAIWHKRMALPRYPVPKTTLAWPNDLKDHPIDILHLNRLDSDKPFRQKGGRKEAIKTLTSFLNGRASLYRGGISSPISSKEACSRISPYLAWGVLSIKEVVQALNQQYAKIKLKPNQFPKHLEIGLKRFESRLHWHCHFIQKLESDPKIEYENLHSAYNHLRDEKYENSEDMHKLQLWKNGQTGWPLVDACMAMLRETGWINFRMRAMLMSTASYLYWLHWRETGLHLAREFLDYEPGIHWSQVQMQSGTTGINTLRIYDPIKQAQDQDPNGEFVRTWIPALKNVPTSWIFEPWLMTPALQERYQCKIGSDYPAPIVSIREAIKEAKRKLSQAKNTCKGTNETKEIIEKHASRKAKKTTSRLVNKKTRVLNEPSIQTQQDLF